MFSFRVFKPIDWKTAAVEVLYDDLIVAEVFAGADGVRRLFVHEQSVERGLDWNGFVQAAPKITAMLDQADSERERSV